MKKVTFIAEAGVNHNGSLTSALTLCQIAKDAGADFIKFQTFSSDKLASDSAELAEYQKGGSSTSQKDLLKSLELTNEEFIQIARYCKEIDLGFLSTGFDVDELNFLVSELKVPQIKIASGDLTFPPLLVEAGKKNLPIILSTGMGNLEEIRTALLLIGFGIGLRLQLWSHDVLPNSSMLKIVGEEGSVQDEVRRLVTVLHCTTAYPAEFGALNLKAIPLIAKTFGCSVGYSDHSKGKLASLLAVALGATVIEKHFTLDKTQSGPDHAASLDPSELSELILEIKQATTALGAAVKVPHESELANRNVVRRSVVASHEIRQGETITLENISCKRPLDGVSSSLFFEVVGSIAKRDFRKGENIA